MPLLKRSPAPFAALAVLLTLSACATAPKDIAAATIDGRPIAYRVMGSGAPAIVMISGLGDGMASFDEVAPEIAKVTTVIVYDRAGYGASAPREGAADAVAFERDLSGLLAQSGVSAPYILVGHSIGGTYAEYFAAKHPDQVAGLVLEDSRPAGFTRRCEEARIGMCTPPSVLTKLMPKGAQREVGALAATMAQVEGIGAARSTPTLVLSQSRKEKPSAFEALWAVAQDDLAARYAPSRHLVAAKSGHYIHRDQKAWLIAVVTDFVRQQRREP